MTLTLHIPPGFFLWVFCIVLTFWYLARCAIKAEIAPALRCPCHTRDWVPCSHIYGHAGDCL